MNGSQNGPMDFSKFLQSVPPEIADCLKQSLGDDYAKLQSGEEQPGPDLGQKTQACFRTMQPPPPQPQNFNSSSWNGLPPGSNPSGSYNASDWNGLPPCGGPDAPCPSSSSGTYQGTMPPPDNFTPPPSGTYEGTMPPPPSSDTYEAPLPPPPPPASDTTSSFLDHPGQANLLSVLGLFVQSLSQVLAGR